MTFFFSAPTPFFSQIRSLVFSRRTPFRILPESPIQAAISRTKILELACVSIALHLPPSKSESGCVRGHPVSGRLRFLHLKLGVCLRNNGC